MKSIKIQLLGLLLAACSVMNASASQFTETFFVPPDLSGAGTLQTFAFTGGDPNAHKGDTFMYDFLFNTPPPNSSFDFVAMADNPATLAFSGLDLLAGDQVTPILNYDLFFTGSMANGYGILDSGTYDVRFSGNFLGDAGSFSGTAAADPAYVPEPMSLALLLVGLVAVAAARRRAATTDERGAQARPC